MQRLILALVLVLVGLTACSGDQPLDVTVNGNFGAPVTISVAGSAASEAVTKDVLIEGDGRALEEDSYVLMRATSFDSRDGSIIDSYNTGAVRLTTVDEEGLGELSSQVAGEKEGTRLLITRPGLTSGAEGAEIVVVDLLPTTAQGEDISIPDPKPKGMPKLTEARGTTPGIASGGGEIPDLEVVPLIQGAGTQVDATDTVIMQYLVADSKGKVTESSWQDSGPISANLQDVMTGLRTGITDQNVGSRLVILVPSAQARGDGDLVIIVDILATIQTTH